MPHSQRLERLRLAQTSLLMSSLFLIPLRRWRRSSQLSSRKPSLLRLLERPSMMYSWREMNKNRSWFSGLHPFSTPQCLSACFVRPTLGGCKLPVFEASPSLLGPGVTVFIPLPGTGLPELTILDGWLTGVSLVHGIPC